MSSLLLVLALASVPPGDAPLLSDKGGRVRWGMSAAIGPFVPMPAAVLSVEVRLGYQLSRRFSVFAASGGGVVIGAYFPHGFLSLIAEYAPVDFFSFGGGPLVSYGALGGYGLESGITDLRERPNQEAYFKPGLDLRLGFGLGEGRPPYFRRGGFNIGIDLQILFHPDMRITWDPRVFSRTDASATIATFAPMLTLGYDSR